MRNRQIVGDLSESHIHSNDHIVEERVFLQPSSSSASVDLEIASDDRVITVSLTAQDACQLIFSLHRAIHEHYREHARAARWQRLQNPKCRKGRKP